MSEPATAGATHGPETKLSQILFGPDTESVLAEFGIDPENFARMAAFMEENFGPPHNDGGEFGPDDAAEAEEDAAEPDDAVNWNEILAEVAGDFGIAPDSARNFFEAMSERRRERILRARRRTPELRPGNEIEFTPVEEWPEPVSAAAILPDLIAAIRRHVAMPESPALVTALWIMHTHALNAFDISPRLIITSAEPGCGKTTLLRLLSSLVARPLEICAASPRAILNSLEYTPTLLIDDGATLLRSSEIANTIRHGRQRSACMLHNARFDLLSLPLFTAAALALHGRLPPALARRSIEIALARFAPSDSILRLRDEHRAPLDQLRRMLARWAGDEVDNLRAAESSRALAEDENWTPLLTIAASAGAQWETHAREAMQQILRQTPTLLQLLLSDIRKIIDHVAAGKFALHGPDGAPVTDTDRVRSADLVRLLAELNGQPWCEWGRAGQPITTHALARLLAEAGVRPSTMHFRAISPGGATSYFTDRGYLVSHFAVAFAHYLGK